MRVLAVIAALYLAACAAEEGKIVCYWGSWSVYRPDGGKFEIENIDPYLCTHLIYTFVGLDGSDVKILDPWQDTPNDYGKDGFGRFNKLKLKNPALKTLIAIGGWNEGSTKYSQMASDPGSRERFADNAVAFVKKWGFDGFDLDWEYPAQRGGSPNDVKNFVKLVRVLGKKLHSQGLLLSAAVAAAESSASQSYDIAEMSKYLDFINLMAYDFHGSWEPITGLNAPLHAASSDSYDARGMNSEAAVKYWLSKGAPKEKLILGVPTYGRAFTLSNPSDNKIGAASSGPGTAGPYTREAGMLGYNEICVMLKENGWNANYDPERKAPWAHKENQWVGFDNKESIKAKAQFAKKMGLGGAMVWSIETDDFRGTCGEKYPLIKTLRVVLRGGKETTEKGTSAGTTVPDGSKGTTVSGGFTRTTVPGIKVPRTTVSGTNVSGTNVPGTKVPGTENSEENTWTPENGSPITPSPSPSGQCKEEGLISDPKSCGFIKCALNDQIEFDEFPMPCPPTLCFDPKLKICNWRKKKQQKY
ncbi:chitotriosidase-1-like isoform X1 [Cotesia glomerata]|nr:chitotriosidase-1-like isoform X1 [Cotesia glomerata]